MKVVYGAGMYYVEIECWWVFQLTNWLSLLGTAKMWKYQTYYTFRWDNQPLTIRCSFEKGPSMYWRHQKGESLHTRVVYWGQTTLQVLPKSLHVSFVTTGPSQERLLMHSSKFLLFRNENAKRPEYFEDLFCNLECYVEYSSRTKTKYLRQVSLNSVWLPRNSQLLVVSH